jgi:hypothetical protein
MLVIERTTAMVPPENTRRYIVVPRSGAVKITDAPLGCEVITWAQRRGELEFKGRRGVTGTLNLRGETVTLSTGEVIESTASPTSKGS